MISDQLNTESIKQIAVQKAIIQELAHDAIQPFTRIIAYLDQAEDQGTPISDVMDQILCYCQDYRQQISRFRQSADQLAPLTIQPINLTEVINNTIKQWQCKDVEIDWRPTGPMICSGDRQAIEFILSELIQNSIQHTLHPAKLSIDLKGGLQENGSPREAQPLLLSVTDFGPGISSEQLPKIWEPDNEWVQKGKNGLIAIHFLVKAMAGSISIQNNIETGITVQIELQP